MVFLLTTVLAVSTVLLLVLIVSRLMGRMPAGQDLMLRAALVVVAVMPLIVAARASDALFIAVPLLSAETPSSEPQDSIEPREQIGPEHPPLTCEPVDVAVLPLPPARVGVSDSKISVRPSAEKTPSSPRPEVSEESGAVDERPGTHAVASVGPPANAPSSRWAWLVGTVWGVGAVLGVASLCVSWWRLRLVLRTSVPATGNRWDRVVSRTRAAVGLRTPVRVRLATGISSPLVAGVVRPAVFVPRDHADLSEDALVQILVHELSHIRRGDQWTNLLMQLVGVVWWPHPLVHWLRRRLCWLREVLSDASAAAATDRVSYAETLLNLAAASRGRSLVQSQLAIEPKSGTLEARIRCILDGSGTGSGATPSRSRSVWLLVTAAMVVVGVVRVVPATPNRVEAVQEDPSQGSTVHGTAVLPNGKPAVGATAYLLQSKGSSFTLPTRPRRTTVGADGSFRFDKVVPGRFMVWAENSEFTSLEKKLRGARIQVKADSAPEPVNLKLHKGCVYEVQITAEETGNPIPGAVISFGWTDIEREFRSGADGVARCSGLSVDDWFFVVRAPGYGMQSRKLTAQPLGSTTKLAFALKPGGSLSGRVLDDSGNPVSGVQVSAHMMRGGMRPNTARAITDKDGRYVLPSLPIDERLRVGTRLKEYEDTQIQFSVRPDLPDTQRDLVIKRRQYAGNAFFVVQDADGKPIGSAHVQNQGNNSGHVRNTNTAPDGRCRLEQLYSSFRGVTVVARAEGFVPQRFTVKPGTTEAKPQTLTLKAGKSIRGRIVDHTGKPRANVRVYYNEGEHGDQLGGRVTTNAEGRFEIHGLPDPCTFTVYTPKGFAPIQDIELPVGGDEVVDVPMKLESVILVRAIDAETRKPLPQYNVKVNFAKRRPGDPSMSLMTDLISQGRNISGRTKHYRLGGLIEGFGLQVRVSADGYETTSVARVDAVPSDRARVLDVELKKDTTPRITVAGRLIMGNRPVVGATVYLIVGDEDPRKGNWRFYNWSQMEGGEIARSPHCLQLLTTTTKGAGRFEFRNVKQAPWLEVFHMGGGAAPGRHPDLVNEAADLGYVTLKADRPGALKVTVDREAWPDADSVELQATNWQKGNAAFTYKSKRLSDKPTVFDTVPAGSYFVSIRSKPEPTGPSSFTLKTLKREQITIGAGSTTVWKFGK